MYRVKTKVFKKQVEMHLTEKNGAPWSETLHLVGLLLVLIVTFYGIAIAEYQKVAKGSIIIIEQAEASWDAREKEEVADEARNSTESGDGVSAPVQEAGEDIESLIRSAFPEHPDIMIAIAKAESGMNPKAPSTTDKMTDGRAFSHGLFQINLTVSEVGGVRCDEAFQGRNYKAHVVNEELFDRCIKLAQDTDISIKVAREKYEERGDFTAWGAYTSGSYKKFLTD